LGDAFESCPVMDTMAPPQARLDDHPRGNPLATDPVAVAGSSYLGPVNGALVRVLDPARPPDAAESAVHDELRARVLGDGYPCVGARSSFNRRLYRFGLYPEMAADVVARIVCHDMYEFGAEMGAICSAFVTFIAVFSRPTITSEKHFERLVWTQLQRMHEVDGRFFPWDPAVSRDPTDERFSYSVGGRAYFIVGLHPLASRNARQFPYAALVFNLHSQFERLRERGKFETFKNMIRARDVAFQGSINPVLANFGNASEAAQYSGRAVETDWRCPFQPNQLPPIDRNGPE
jgi:uncharacterized protein